MTRKTLPDRRQCRRVIPGKSGLFGQGLLPCGMAGSVSSKMTSLVLTREFQGDCLKIIFLGEAEATITLSVKSQIADVGLSMGDCILGLLCLF